MKDGDGHRAAPDARALGDAALQAGERFVAMSGEVLRTPAELLGAVDALRVAALELERQRDGDITACTSDARAGARNLLHYLALRRHDLRPLQTGLSALGLSSLGRIEGRVVPTLEAVARALRALAGERVEATDVGACCDVELGRERLAAAAARLLGPAPRVRDTRIMVTLSATDADGPEPIEALLDAGADLVRINAAHDDPATWSALLARLDQARERRGHGARVAFDLAGPKLRTGPMVPGPAVVRLRPRRDPLGRVLAPARATLVPTGRDRLPAGGEIPVPAKLLRRLVPDDVLEFVDARGRARRLRVVRPDPAGRPVCETDRTAYLVPGTALVHRRGRRVLAEGEIGALPALPGGIALAPGDRLDLVVGGGPGRDRQPGLGGAEARPAEASCDVREAFEAMAPGHRVLFDDGRIETVIRSVSDGRACVEVVRCVGGRATLREEKGINLPDTPVALSAFGTRDLDDLVYAAPRADLVSASFVRSTADVDALREALAANDATHAGLVLKIETAEAFAGLPDLLLRAMRHPGGVAVMVARGDLAVEVGFERLAEVQEEILWLCEAAHVPVIWATQVLDGLTREGVPTRAEVTDAAMSGRAECVMLNKGPHVAESVRFLSGVLERMQAHQRKKTATLRALAVSAPPSRRR